MRARLTLASAIALPLLVFGHAAPAGAAVTTSPLPDATLFCGPEQSQVDYGWPVVGADSFWIHGDTDYAGHWNLLAYEDYYAEGLLHEPASVEGLFQFPGKSFGSKSGQTTQLECVLVSRWDLPGDTDDFTILALMTFVRAR